MCVPITTATSCSIAFVAALLIVIVLGLGYRCGTYYERKKLAQREPATNIVESPQYEEVKPIQTVSQLEISQNVAYGEAPKL